MPRRYVLPGMLILAGDLCRRAVAGAALGVLVCLLLPSTVSADAEDEYNLALQFYKQERWELAVGKLQEFLKQAPADHGKVPLAKLYLGQALVHQRRFAEARPVFRDFVENHPGQEDLPLAMYRVAECSYFVGDLNAARDELNAFLKKVPADHALAEWGWMYLGEAELQLGQAEPARVAFATGLERFAKGRLVDELRFGLARAHEGLNQVPAAEAVYQQLAQGSGPRAADALFNLAARQFEQQKYQLAAERFAAIAARFTEHKIAPLAMLNAGYSHYHLGAFPQAMEFFEKVRGNAQYGPTAEYWTGLSLKSQGKYDEASQVLLQQYQRDEQQPLAESLLFHAADSHLGAKEYAQAMPLFEEVSRRWPQGELADDSLHLATESAVLAGDVAAARRLHQQFAATFPESGLLLPQNLLWGRLLLVEGDQLARVEATAEEARQRFRDAAEAFSQIVDSSTIEATRALARLQLARAWDRLANHEQVLATLQPLVDEVTESNASESAATALVMQSTALLALKRYDESLAAARRYLGLQSQGADAADALANVCLSHAHQQGWAAIDEPLGQLRTSGPAELADRVTYEVAEIGYQAQAWEPAQTHYQQIVDRGPDGPFYRPAVSGLAYSLHEQGRALDQEVAAAQQAGDSATSLVAQAVRTFDAAALWFTRLAEISAQPQDRVVQSDALYMKGLSLRLARRLPTAIEVFLATAKQFGLPEATSNLDEPTLKAGYNAYRSAKEAARAAQELQQIDQADAAYQVAFTQLKRQPVDRQEGLDALINEWALAHYNAGDFDRANELFQRLVDERPASQWADDARMLIAESDYFAERYEPARESFRKLVEDERTDDFVRERSLVLLMDIAARLDDWKEAAATAQRLAERFPQGAHRWEARYRQGEAALRLEDLPTAQTVLTELAAQRDDAAIAGEEWFPGVWLMLAETHLRLKQYDKVEETADDFQAQFPDSPLQYHLDDVRGRAWQRQARFDQARDAFAKVIASPQGKGTETAAKAQLFVAETYFVEKKYEQAFEEYYRVLLYGFPEWQAAALFQAGKCEELLKRWKGAATSYRQLLEDHPASEYADDARQRLGDLEKRFPETVGS